jgi:two-component system, response regulator YesN
MNELISVLIVDDNPSMANILAEVLEAKGFQVHPVSSGLEALKFLNQHPVDILLTDVIMPEINGVELYREAQKIHPQLTTILMTAYSADELIQQGMREGIRTILNKPIDIDFLLSLLKAVGRMKGEQ